MKFTIIFATIIVFVASKPFNTSPDDVDFNEKESNETFIQDIIGFTLRNPKEMADRLKDIPLETNENKFNESTESTASSESNNSKEFEIQSMANNSSETTTTSTSTTQDE